MIFTNARVAQLVEHHLAKVDVASSNLVSRSEDKPLISVRGFSYAIISDYIRLMP